MPFLRGSHLSKIWCYLVQGPNFSNISKAEQPAYMSAICSLVASIQRCAGLWRLHEVHFKFNTFIKDLRLVIKLILNMSRWTHEADVVCELSNILSFLPVNIYPAHYIIEVQHSMCFSFSRFWVITSGLSIPKLILFSVSDFAEYHFIIVSIF